MEKYSDFKRKFMDLHGRNSCYTNPMIALNIEDQKLFTRLLFVTDTFDNFELVEGEFVTRFSANLDGTLTEEDSDARYVRWGDARNIAFQIIKGKQLPRAFRLTMRLTEPNMEKTLASIGKTAESTNITSLLFNIRYEHEALMLITGCAYSTFTPDRTAEREWDELMLKFLMKHEIPYLRS